MSMRTLLIDEATRLPSGYVEKAPDAIVDLRIDVEPFTGGVEFFYELSSEDTFEAGPGLSIFDVTKGTSDLTFKVSGGETHREYFIVCKLIIGDAILLPTGLVHVR